MLYHYFVFCVWTPRLDRLDDDAVFWCNADLTSMKNRKNEICWKKCGRNVVFVEFILKKCYSTAWRWAGSSLELHHKQRKLTNVKLGNSDEFVCGFVLKRPTVSSLLISHRNFSLSLFSLPHSRVSMKRANSLIQLNLEWHLWTAHDNDI